MTGLGARLRTRLPESVQSALPRGRILPDRSWRARHRGILVLLWLHVGTIPVYALARGFGIRHVVLEAGVVMLPAIVASSSRLGRRPRTLAASFGLLSSSAVLVHLSGGLIEMHFHFFVMVATVSLYQDWLPFLAAIAYVFVHHGLLGALDPPSVYNHLAARNDPWRWAGIHAIFITGSSLASLVTWRLNEQFIERQRRTETRLREETRIVEALHDVGRTLAAELDLERVVQAVVDAGTQLTEATSGAFIPSDRNGREPALSPAFSDAAELAFAGLQIPEVTGVFSAAGVVRMNDIAAAEADGQAQVPRGAGTRSLLAAPVRSRGGGVVGGLVFGHSDQGHFGDIEERLIAGIAAQAAVAIDNARLYESERRSRVISDAARSDLALLAEASRVLTSSLEIESILAGLTELIVPRVGDVCTVDLLTEEGVCWRAASAATQTAEWAAETTLPEVIDAIRQGQTTVLRNEAAMLGRGTTVIAPLLRREPIGAISVATGGTDERLDERGVHLVEELARRAALAVENALLYARQRTVAETLQHSLLPESLPAIPGISAVARYMPGGPGVEIGGDWYDVLQLPHGNVALAMGDVVGKGEKAAALMVQLRSALRAFSLGGAAPVETVERLNDLLFDLGPDNMATMTYAVLEPDTGTLRVVNAGHPPPLVLMPGEGATFLETGHGVPLGAVQHAYYTETVTTIMPGALVILYTDGLVEDRRTPLDAGCRLLLEAAISGPAELERLCDHILLRSLAGRNGDDDIALLVLRLDPLGTRLHLRMPCELSALPTVRSAVRRWLTTMGASESAAFDILVAVGEACSNAVRHANGPGAAWFELEAVAEGDIVVRVADEGRWREPRPQGGGRGLELMKQLMDSVDISATGSGTEVRMRRSLGVREKGLT